MVTWFYLSLPPVSSQTTFESGEACDRAKMSVVMEAARLKNQAAKPERGAFSIPAAVPPYPTVSVFCAPIR